MTGAAVRKPTISDVASVAGVSVTTVSHALSGNRPVSAATRRRVVDAVEQLGYEPDAAAQRLRNGRTFTIALVSSIPAVYGMHSTHVQVFMDHAIAGFPVAGERGYSLLIVPPVDADAALRRMDVDGAIVVNPIDDDPVVGILMDRGIPVVAIGEVRFAGEVLPHVDSAVTVTELALEHLVLRGAERPGILVADEQHAVNRGMRLAYERWCREKGIEPCVLALADGLEYADAVASLSAFQPRLREACDALYVPLDTFAAAAHDVVLAQGGHPGEDFLLVCRNDSPTMRDPRYDVSVFVAGAERLSEVAVDMLIDRLEGRETLREVSAPRILMRGSSLGRG